MAINAAQKSGGKLGKNAEIFKFCDLTSCPNEPPFPDLNSKTWYYKYVKKAYNLGVIKGMKDGYLRPDMYLSEKEGQLIVNRISKLLAPNCGK